MNLRTILLAGAGALFAAVAPAMAQPPEHRDPFAMLDANGDGQVTLAEFRAHAAEMFRHIDTDGDGRATLEDFRAAHDKMRAEHSMHGGMAGGHDGPPPPQRDGADRRGPPPGGHRGPPPPEQLDADHDGVVTLAEFTAGMEQHFAAADADHDGVVTRAEMDAAHGGMHRPR
jgi:hypothetical protein